MKDSKILENTLEILEELRDNAKIKRDYYDGDRYRLKLDGYYNGLCIAHQNFLENVMINNEDDIE